MLCFHGDKNVHKAKRRCTKQKQNGCQNLEYIKKRVLEIKNKRNNHKLK